MEATGSHSPVRSHETITGGVDGSRGGGVSIRRAPSCQFYRGVKYELEPLSVAAYDLCVHNFSVGSHQWGRFEAERFARCDSSAPRGATRWKTRREKNVKR